MSISMIGIDHSMAPVDIRALFAFTRKNAGEAMEKLKEQPKKDNDNFCISSRGKVKTLETLNTRLKYITEKNGLPIITMYDLRDMYVWILLEKDCPWEEIQKLTAASLAALHLLSPAIIS